MPWGGFIAHVPTDGFSENLWNAASVLLAMAFPVNSELLSDDVDAGAAAAAGPEGAAAAIGTADCAAGSAAGDAAAGGAAGGAGAAGAAVAAVGGTSTHSGHSVCNPGARAGTNMAHRCAAVATGTAGADLGAALADLNFAFALALDFVSGDGEGLLVCAKGVDSAATTVAMLAWRGDGVAVRGKAAPLGEELLLGVRENAPPGAESLLGVLGPLLRAAQPLVGVVTCDILGLAGVLQYPAAFAEVGEKRYVTSGSSVLPCSRSSERLDVETRAEEAVLLGGPTVIVVWPAGLSLLVVVVTTFQESNMSRIDKPMAAGAVRETIGGGVILAKLPNSMKVRCTGISSDCWLHGVSS